MAMIHVNRGATSLGAFPEEQVREGIRAGRFLSSDLGWREGMANWQPLSQFAEFAEDFSASRASSAPPPQLQPLRLRSRRVQDRQPRREADCPGTNGTAKA